MSESLKRRVAGSLFAVELMQLVKSSDLEDADYMDGFLCRLNRDFGHEEITDVADAKAIPIARLGGITMPFGQHKGKCLDDVPLFGESYSDGDDWVEYPFSRQKCFGCELPCKLWKQIETMQQRLAELWKCVELYSKKDNWGCSTLLSEDHDCESEPEKCCWDEWQGPAGVHGYEPAQECWKKVEAMKGGGS